MQVHNTYAIMGWKLDKQILYCLWEHRSMHMWLEGTFLCSPLILCAFKVTLHAAYPFIHCWYCTHTTASVCSNTEIFAVEDSNGLTYLAAYPGVSVYLPTHPYRHATEFGSLFEFYSIAIKVKWHRKREYKNSRRRASSATFHPIDTHYTATRMKKNFRIKNIFQISALL